MEKMGKEIDKLSNELTALRWEFWEKHTLFTWQWWCFLAVCVLFAALAVVLLRRRGLVSAVAYYGAIYVLNKNLDDWATAMDWYDYRMQLEPIIPTMLPANLFAVPIALTILYQRLPRWRGYLAGLAAFSAIVSYAVLPLAEWAGIYLTKEWNAHFSMLSLLAMGAIAKGAVDGLKRLEAGDAPKDRAAGGKVGYSVNRVDE
ncbi:hypothetical protein [Paenibacillus sp.]|uniref:hypothetical protein n=1 Tax=Paenibacillus sp. TaxID=58172 RepID=UPI002D73F264|nr:hypothetical protein [Paenibacillus sp.]HZG56217.1 hypothetical protein [Paenibacillus sp.]